MVESDSNPPPKKSPLRKKVVDLKAVAALLEESDGRDAVSRETAMKEAAPQAGSASQPGSGPQAGEGTAPLAAPQAGSAPSSKPVFQPNEELIQATSRIKTQRDLIKRRFQKMEQNRDKVTKGVFDKVYRDYAMQLDAINKLLGEKKALLHRELKNLYTRREKQDLDMTRHKEILEEARFRHYLDEYSEAQFKEVEEYETREIRQLQGELAQIQSFIKLHEELFDPEDLGFAPTGGGSRGMESRTEMRRVAAPPAPATPLAPATPRLGTGPRPDMDDWAEKTPLPEKAAVPAPSRASATSRAPAGEEMARILPSADAGEDSVFALPPEGFGPEGLAPDEPGYFSAEAPAKAGEPESIFDVFEKMPLGAEVSSTEPKGGMETAQPVSGRQVGSVVAPLAASQPGSGPQAGSAPARYKLTFLEGDMDIPDFEMKDNVSIGRSPSNDLVLTAPKVSRQHAAINKYKDQYIIIDLKSSNGVYVNGRKVDEHVLMEGDQISVGGYKFVFQKI